MSYTRSFAFRRTLQFLDRNDSSNHILSFIKSPCSPLHSTLFIKTHFSLARLSCLSTWCAEKHSNAFIYVRLCVGCVGSGGCSHEWRIYTLEIHSTSYTTTIIYFDFDGVCHVSVEISGDRSHSLIHLISAVYTHSNVNTGLSCNDEEAHFQNVNWQFFFIDLFFLANMKRNRLIVSPPFLRTRST